MSGGLPRIGIGAGARGARATRPRPRCRTRRRARRTSRPNACASTSRRRSPRRRPSLRPTWPTWPFATRVRARCGRCARAAPATPSSAAPCSSPRSWAPRCWRGSPREVSDGDLAQAAAPEALRGAQGRALDVDDGLARHRGPHATARLPRPAQRHQPVEPQQGLEDHQLRPPRERSDPRQRHDYGHHQSLPPVVPPHPGRAPRSHRSARREGVAVERRARAARGPRPQQHLQRAAHGLRGPRPLLRLGDARRGGR